MEGLREGLDVLAVGESPGQPWSKKELGVFGALMTGDSGRFWLGDTAVGDVAFSDHLSLVVNRMFDQNRISFDILPRAFFEPTDETRHAMMAAEAKGEGLILDDSIAFASVADAMEWLEAE